MLYVGKFRGVLACLSLTLFFLGQLYIENAGISNFKCIFVKLNATIKILKNIVKVFKKVLTEVTVYL